MEPQDYIVTDIRGEYAVLSSLSDGNEMFIALALLPSGTDVSRKLHYENLEYSLLD